MPKAGDPSRNGTPGPLFRALAGFSRIAESLGLVKEREGMMLRGMSEFAGTFLGESAWLTGGLPLEPKEPPGSPPRKFQYQPGYNIQIQPRSTEALTFAQLRALSEYTIVRVIIEHIKKQLKGHEWDIVPVDRSDPDSHAEEISAVKRFLERPDRRTDWDEWLGRLVDETLSIDALAIYRHRLRNGRTWALEIIDGGTIKVLADERGFEPMGSEAGQEVPAWQQFLYGVPYCNLKPSDLYYLPRNRRANKFYGFSETEQIVIVINMGLRRELYDLAMFTDSNVPAGLAGVPEDWGPEEIKGFQQYFDSVLSGDAQNRSRIRFVPRGFEFTKFRDEEVFGLVNKFDEWLARISCFTFGISPMAFIQLTNRAVAQEMGDVEAEGGVAAMKMFVERVMNRIIRDDVGFPHLEFNWTTDRGRLMAKRVARNVEYVKHGIVKPNEVREEEGLAPEPKGNALYFNGQPLGEAPPPAIAGRPGVPARPIAEPDGDPGSESSPRARALAENRELENFEKAALRKLAEAAPPPAWRAEFIGADEAAEIRTGLAKAKFPDEVRFIFASRRRKIPPLKLDPPAARDAAGHAAELVGALRSVLEREARRVADQASAKKAAPALVLEPAVAKVPVIDFKPQIIIPPPERGAPGFAAAVPLLDLGELEQVVAKAVAEYERKKS